MTCYHIGLLRGVLSCPVECDTIQLPGQGLPRARPAPALQGTVWATGPLGRHLKSNLTSTHRSSAMGDRRLCLGAHCSVVKTGRARSARSRFGPGCCRTGSLVLRVFALSTIQFVWTKIGGGYHSGFLLEALESAPLHHRCGSCDIVQFKHPRKNQN